MTMGQYHFPQGINSPGQLGLSWASRFDDFLGDSTVGLAAGIDVTDWLSDVAATATVTMTDLGSTGEMALFGTSAADVVSVQPNGGPMILAPGKRLLFETRCKVTGITTDTDELWGMAIRSALPLGTTGLPHNFPFIGFVKTGATGSIDAITQTATATKTTTSAVGTFVADTYKTFRVEWDGIGKVRFWIDGALVAVHENPTNIPAATSLLLPTFALQTIDAGAADFSFTIDYVHNAAQR